MRTALAAILLLLAAHPAHAQFANPIPCTKLHMIPGQDVVDPGISRQLPNGGVEFTYADGWQTTIDPDNSYGAGGFKITEHDGKGPPNTNRLTFICKYDASSRIRFEVIVDYGSGKPEKTEHFYDAYGRVIY